MCVFLEFGIYAEDGRGYFNWPYYLETGRKMRPLDQETFGGKLQHDNSLMALKRLQARQRQHQHTPGYQASRSGDLRRSGRHYGRRSNAA